MALRPPSLRSPSVRASVVLALSRAFPIFLRGKTFSTANSNSTRLRFGRLLFRANCELRRALTTHGGPSRLRYFPSLESRRSVSGFLQYALTGVERQRLPAAHPPHHYQLLLLPINCPPSSVLSLSFSHHSLSPRPPLSQVSMAHALIHLVSRASWWTRRLSRRRAPRSPSLWSGPSLTLSRRNLWFGRTTFARARAARRRRCPLHSLSLSDTPSVAVSWRRYPLFCLNSGGLWCDNLISVGLPSCALIALLRTDIPAAAVGLSVAGTWRLCATHPGSL